MQPIDQARLSRLKPSFVTRRVKQQDVAWLDSSSADLKAGDLVIARVDEIGQHARIERPDGRRAYLFPGDEILVACGPRYAPDQFEADCPQSPGPASLVAAGGIAGIVRSSHGSMKPATGITILGALCRQNGGQINLADYGLANATQKQQVPIVAVCGTSMNAGKTHTVASMVRGFSRAGLKVAAIKATGTGAGGDLWHFLDSGAHVARDFTDAGFASTYRVPAAEIFGGIRKLVTDVEESGAEVIVLELADGLFQSETAELLGLDMFRSMLSGLVFAAADAMGAQAGVQALQAAGLPLCAVSGRIARSPLAMREMEAAVDLSCITAEDLEMAETVVPLIEIPEPARHKPAA